MVIFKIYYWEKAHKISVCNEFVAAYYGYVIIES